MPQPSRCTCRATCRTSTGFHPNYCCRESHICAEAFRTCQPLLVCAHHSRGAALTLEVTLWHKLLACWVAINAIGQLALAAAVPKTPSHTTATIPLT